jgi:hypothetical protein
MSRKRRQQKDLPPFDVVFCRDDPDAEIIFVFDDAIHTAIEARFSWVEWTPGRDGWHIACIARDASMEIAVEAMKMGYRVAYAEMPDGVLVFSPCEISPIRMN